jgi:hypothetical protein
VSRLAQRREKVALFVAFEQRITQIAGGDEPRGQPRDLAFLFFNDGVEDRHE